MWANHLQAISLRKAKLHPSSSSTTHASVPAAISFNAVNLNPEHGGGATDTTEDNKERGTQNSVTLEQQQSGKGKITAVVNVPQSRYEYHPLEPPIIETPQLRDMGEATPPLEWIGLNRERLPNLTHQVWVLSDPVQNDILILYPDCHSEFTRDCPRSGRRIQAHIGRRPGDS